MMDSSLQEKQAALHKQKIEGFSEYSNSLNSLNSKSFSQFLVTSPPTLRCHSSDFKNFVKDGVKPYSAIRDIVSFFTKEEDSVLEVFSGYGETLRLLSDIGRKGTGIENDSRKILSYKNSVFEDTFLEEARILEGDALSVSSSLQEKFDFILVDPPIKTQKFDKRATNIEDLPIDLYVRYLSSLLDSLAKNLKEGKFLVLLLQDFYHKGVYHMLSSLIALSVSSLYLKGIKIYSRQLDTSNIPNKKVYAPVQNHFYALIFTLCQ